MRTAIQAVFLLAIVGMPIVYLMYFFVLNDFKNKLITLNKDAWDRFVGIGAPQNLENAYRALQQSSKGQLAGIALCDEVMLARKEAARLLYVAMSLFMLVLAVGLTEAVLNK